MAEALLLVSEQNTAASSSTLFSLQSITLKFNSIKKKHSRMIRDNVFFSPFFWYQICSACSKGFIRCLEVYEASLFISRYLVFKYNLYDTRKTAVKFTERR